MDAITSISISPDNKFIYSGSKDCTIRTWEIEKCPKQVPCITSQNSKHNSI
jgi:WD40 repeat protein